MNTVNGQENMSCTTNTCTRPPSDETFKEKMARLVRDADKGNTCVSCGGNKMATVDAVDNFIEWIITKFRGNATKQTTDTDKS